MTTDETSSRIQSRSLKASVVVPVRNGGAVLPKLMKALDAQTLSRSEFEVIIGDDGSTDGATQGLETPDGHVRVTAGPALTSDAARNRAAALARSDVLAFCDADCIPAPDWLENGLEALRHSDLVAGFVGAIGSKSPTLWGLLDLDTWLDQERMVRFGGASTQNLFVTRHLFERVGGYDETLHYFGDFEFVSRCQAAGAGLIFYRAAEVTTTTYDDARSFFRKAWKVNEAYGWHEGRNGRKPLKLKAREWVPLVQPVRARRRSGCSLLLDRKVLSENGFQPRRWQDAAALPIQYLVLPYIGCVGQSLGWWHGRRLAGSGA